MEFKSGIEPTEKYCSMETMNGALKLVRDVMLAKEGETVVVTCDSSGDRRVAEAIGDAAYAIGAKPIILYLSLIHIWNICLGILTNFPVGSVKGLP